MQIIWSDEFAKWLKRLRDKGAYERISIRIVRLERGLFGDAKPVGGGVSELKIDVGPGYRVYFQQKGNEIILLLLGGDKSSQAEDIKKAHVIAAAYQSDRSKKP